MHEGWCFDFPIIKPSNFLRFPCKTLCSLSGYMELIYNRLSLYKINNHLQYHVRAIVRDLCEFHFHPLPRFPNRFLWNSSCFGDSLTESKSKLNINRSSKFFVLTYWNPTFKCKCVCWRVRHVKYASSSTSGHRCGILGVRWYFEYTHRKAQPFDNFRLRHNSVKNQDPLLRNLKGVRRLFFG